MFLKVLHNGKNEALKKRKGNYKAFCTQSQKALEDIRFWKEQAVKYHRKIDLAAPKHTVFTDALNEGCGGHFESLSASGRRNLSEIDGISISCCAYRETKRRCRSIRMKQNGCLIKTFLKRFAEICSNLKSL